MLISEAVVLMEHANKRKDIMEQIGVSSPLISSWKNSEKDRIPTFPAAVRIYGWYNIVVYPYDENDLMDKWAEMREQV